MASVGKKNSHQAVTMRARPSATIKPQAGVGFTSPAPRKLNVDSRMMTWPTSRVASTTTVFTTLGNMCRIIMRSGEAPATCARAIKSCCLMASASPRTIRANRAHSNSAITSTTVWKPGPLTATSTNASRIDGKASLMSTMRIISVSTQPPR